MPDQPTADQKLSALETGLATLMRRVESLVVDQQIRADSKKDEAEKPDQMAALTDAVATLTKHVADLKRGDRSRGRSDEDKDEDDDRQEDAFPGEPKASENEPNDDPAEEGNPRDVPSTDDEHHERKDRRARADSGMRQRLARLEDQLPHLRSSDELNALAECQQEWDRVAQMHGKRASRPLDGERIVSYDRRMAKVFQKFSDKWAGENLADLPGGVLTKIAAPEIRADATNAAYRVEPGSGGLLREIRKTDRSGRVISEFVGPIDAANGAFEPFRMPTMYVRKINTKPNDF